MSKMIPVAPTAKRLNGFSIDSLMSKDSPTGRSSPTPGASPPKSTGSISPHSPPSHRQQSPHALHGSSFHPVSAAGSRSYPSGVNFLYPGADHGPVHPEALSGYAGHLSLSPLANLHPHGLPGLAGGSHASLHAHHPMHPMFINHQHTVPPREQHYPFYPWLLSRHPGFHRFGGPDLAASLLLQPFRKPKRIRTAFSPSQLLRLEHAFEKNHYVVGQERKDLASSLGLTETQVKVWFQNRRTKYKRFKAEDEDSVNDNSTLRSSHDQSDDESDHEIIPDNTDDEYSDSADENRTPSPVSGKQSTVRASHHLNRWRTETNMIPPHLLSKNE